MKWQYCDDARIIKQNHARQTQILSRGVPLKSNSNEEIMDQLHQEDFWSTCEIILVFKHLLPQTLSHILSNQQAVQQESDLVTRICQQGENQRLRDDALNARIANFKSWDFRSKKYARWTERLIMKGQVGMGGLRTLKSLQMFHG